MKRKLHFLISAFIFILSGGISKAQTLVFHEDFEVVDSMTSSGTPAWTQDPNYHTNGAFCIRNTVSVNGTSYLTSDAFSTTGNFFVQLYFDQICKINFADQASVEASNDNGVTWVPLTAANYTGGSVFFPAFNYFSSFSYGASGWNAASDVAIPQSSWWRSESFDLSSVAGNSAQAKIRFKLTDGNGNGSAGNYGWLIDQVHVHAAPHELDAPHISWSPPVLLGPIYYLGPFTVSDTITDASTLGSVQLHYTVNGGAPFAVSMTNTSGNIWQGIIPAMNDGDTVCYYVDASDIWANTSILPVFGCNTFTASSGITFPYVDNFDLVTNLWTASSTSGSTWQLGTPAFGATNSAHSSPNAWDIDLASGYLNSTTATLTSPVFNFIGVNNATLSFWRNHRTEAGWDGTRLEYTTDGTTWLVLGTQGDPLSTNWYTDASINSSNKPAWDNNSAGWKNSTYKLTAFNNLAGPVQFRFIFTSDNAGTQDGFSIDDFSIIPAPPQDAALTSILRPGISSASGINDTVVTVISNTGNLPISNFNVSYSVNGGAPVAQLYSDTLQPGISDTVVFATPYVVPAGTFSLCAFTSLTGDGNHFNDSLCKNSQGIALVTIPYTDNFDTLPSLWYDSSSAGTQWQLGTPNFGATNSAFSAPNAWDINLSTAYGPNAHSVLTSPLFNFTGVINAKLSFWMNRNIDPGGDGAFLEYSVNAGNSWQRLGIVGDPNALYGDWYNVPNINTQPGWNGSSGGWKKYTYILGPPFNNAGTNVQFRFVFTSNAIISTDGISIDNFAITPASPVDLGVTFVVQPGASAAAGSSATAQVLFRNFGTSTVNTADLGYNLNGSLVATETWNGSIAPSTSLLYTFTTPFIVPAGSFDICAFTSLIPDGDHLNDTTCKSSNGIPRFTLPYADNFDTGAVVWIDSSAAATSWQHGTPAFGQTTGSHSGSSCWDINLTTSYQNNAKSYLSSPLFDFTGITNATLSFWQNRNAEATWDGTRLEYSINGGSTWAVLGTVNDPNAVNWYTDPSLNSSNLPAWEGISNNAGIPGWVQSTYHLPPSVTGPNVRFRFVFTSDGSQVRDGFSMDDFMLTPPGPHDVGVTAILRPGISALAGSTDTVQVVIYNFGSDTTSNFTVAYQINAAAAVVQNYPGTLQPSAFDTITFTTTYVVPASNFNICAWTGASVDNNHFNDTLCKTPIGQQRFPLPYTDNFDSGLPVWHNESPGPGTNWQLGTPAFGQTTGSFSSPSCWDINLTVGYGANALSYLVSPLFDFTGATNTRLSFWQNRNAEDGWDGTRLEYSVNAGNTWVILGTVNDTNAINWYTDVSINSSMLPAWDSISLDQSGIPGWQQSVYLNLPPAISGQDVMFRFVFTSDAAVERDGFSIDNFRLYEPLVGIKTTDGATVAWEIYPNPSTGIFYLSQADRSINSSILVTDVIGNEIWKGSQNKTGLTAIDLSSHPNGIYFVSVATENETVNRRIILCK